MFIVEGCLLPSRKHEHRYAKSKYMLASVNAMFAFYVLSAKSHVFPRSLAIRIARDKSSSSMFIAS